MQKHMLASCKWDITILSAKKISQRKNILIVLMYIEINVYKMLVKT